MKISRELKPKVLVEHERKEPELHKLCEPEKHQGICKPELHHLREPTKHQRICVSEQHQKECARRNNTCIYPCKHDEMPSR
eukprot:15258243-Ditylum_brightwellii.AAC.1